MTQTIINRQESVESNKITLDQKCIAEVRMAIIVSVLWVILAPFAIWFGVVNIQNFWLAIIPLAFGCVGIIPLIGCHALVNEYRAALRGDPAEKAS